MPKIISTIVDKALPSGIFIGYMPKIISTIVDCHMAWRKDIVAICQK